MVNRCVPNLCLKTSGETTADAIGTRSECKYPCSVCNSEIEDGGCAAVECAGTCGKWMHAPCCGLPKKLPNYLIDNCHVSFFCDACNNQTSSATEEVTTVHDLVSGYKGTNGFCGNNE